MNRLSNRRSEAASTLLCALGTISVVSFIGAGVLMNCTARYNTTSKHIKGWKEALNAADAGGEVAFNEVRKAIEGVVPGAGTPFTGTGWTTIEANKRWRYSLPAGLGDGGNQSATVEVDRLFDTPAGDGIYRIRSVGTAKLYGMSRTGLEDGATGGSNFAINGRTRGDADSLVRKIDFKNDHFIATYGDGDMTAGTVGVNAAVTHPKVTRRVELVAVPVMPINGAIKALVGYQGNGADSYDSKNPINPNNSSVNGSYWGPNPTDPILLADAHNGNVSVNTGTFSGSFIWGDITTNGGNVAKTQASGTVDNNVPINIPPYALPSDLPTATVITGGTDVEIPSPATPALNFKTAPTYSLGTVAGLTVKGFKHPTSGKPVETYVNVIVNGDLDDGKNLRIEKGVNVRIYFKGDVEIKAKYYFNENADLGPVASSNAAATVLEYIPPSTPLTGAALTNHLAQDSSYMPSDNYSRAGHVQFYGVSGVANQTFAVEAPGAIHAMIYAPSTTFTLTGNPDLFGAIVCAAWKGNGNTTFHFDKQLAEKVRGIDYRVASYVEDVR